MRKLLAPLAALPLLLTLGCGGHHTDSPPSRSAVLADIRANAHTSTHLTDQQVWSLIETFCHRGMVFKWPSGLSDHDQGYILGIALSAVCTPHQP